MYPHIFRLNIKSLPLFCHSEGDLFKPLFLWPHPSAENHDLNKLCRSLLSIKFTLFWLDFLNIFLYERPTPHPIVTWPYTRIPHIDYNLPIWGCFHTIFNFSANFFLEKKSFKDVLLIFLCKPPPPLVLWINDLNKRKSTLPKYVSIQVPAFLAEWFLIERFWSFFYVFSKHM